MTRKPRWADAWGPPETSTRVRTKTWNQPLAWNRKAEKEGRRCRVFCASLGDVFEHNAQVAQWRLDLWDLIDATPKLDWLLLTKRPENIMDFVPELWKHGFWPAHVLPGTSIEDQATADKRIPLLLQIPAPVRFVSAEPLLGPVNAERYMYDSGYYCWNCGYEPSGNIHKYNLFTCAQCGAVWDGTHYINWVIVGGESGPHARPMRPDWARSLRDQCQNAGVPFFFKQQGEWLPFSEWPNGYHGWTKAYSFDPSYNGRPDMVRVGKKAAGRLLDGREWNEYPAAVTAPALGAVTGMK